MRGKNYGKQPARSTGGQQIVRTVYSSVEESTGLNFRKLPEQGEIFSPLHNYIVEAQVSFTLVRLQSDLFYSAF